METLFSDFVKDNLVYLIVGCAIVLLVVVGFLIYFAVLKHKRIAPAEPAKVVDQGATLESLGGASNVIYHSLRGSRIILQLQDYSKLDKKKLQDAGVDSFIEMSDKLTLVMKSGAKELYESLFPNS